jgi:hypothetical protein
LADTFNHLSDKLTAVVKLLSSRKVAQEPIVIGGKAIAFYNQLFFQLRKVMNKELA